MPGIAPRVLLVEDDAKLAGLLARALTEAGLTVDRVGTVGLALDAALDRRHDVLVVDVLLRDGDGLELCERLRRAGVAQPVLVISAFGDPGRERLARAGADAFLAKPFALDDLLGRLARLVRATSA